MDPSDDLVSVVVPVYNSEEFLKEAIESVLNQTYNNIEIIVVDDGSSDNSLKILKQYSNKITIISQTNRGLAHALNAGIKNMNGIWIKWFSPDDVLKKDAIEILVNEAKKLQENTIVYSNWEIIDENNNKLRDFLESNYNNLDNFEYNVRLLDGQQINVNTTLIPVSLVNQGCLIQELDDPVAIDYDFFLRAGILFNTSFHLVSKPLVQYRIHTNQLSHKNISKTLDYLAVIRNQILSKLEQSKREQYLDALKEYEGKKSLSKKTMELGLKVLANKLPDWVTDRLLVFYLNRIRRSR